MTITAHSAPHLFDRWQDISRRIKSARHIRLLLDFDGTLVSYRSRPNLVKLAAASRRVLRRLARHPRLQIAIVSGRRSGVLQQFVGIEGIDLLGLYGAEDNGDLAVPSRTIRALPDLAARLAIVPATFPGSYIEEKGVAFAVHFRAMRPHVRTSLQGWLLQLAPHIRDKFRILRSHTAWEIVPRQVQGKGAAVRVLMKKTSDSLPIYVGDDLTDEPAFKALRRGITIRVGEKSATSARYRLRNPNEVREFLERLEEELP